MGNFHSDTQAPTPTFGNMVSVCADVISRNRSRWDINDSADMVLKVEDVSVRELHSCSD